MTMLSCPCQSGASGTACKRRENGTSKGTINGPSCDPLHRLSWRHVLRRIDPPCPDPSWRAAPARMPTQTQESTMQTLEVDQTIAIRRIQPGDAERCGQIAFEAHRDVAARHNFPSEQPSIEFSIGLIKTKLADSNTR